MRKIRDQLPPDFSQQGEKGIHRRELRYHLNKKEKEGMEFRQIEIPSLLQSQHLQLAGAEFRASPGKQSAAI